MRCFYPIISVLLFRSKMRYFYLGLMLFSFALTSKGQFAPQAGVMGTSAIHKDSNVFVNWATGCTLNRGWQNISDTTMGKAQVGDETYVPGQAGNGIVSLGDGGVAIILFEKPIMNGNGYDFAVFENGFIDQTLKPGTAFLELAFVEVSSDGTNFFRFDAVCLNDTLTQLDTYEGTDATKLNNFAGKYIGNYGTPFDLDELKDQVGLDVMNITHIKVVDVIGNITAKYCSRDSRGFPVNDPWPTPFAQSGFDLDAVGVIHQNNNVGLVEVEARQSVYIYPNPAQKNEIIHVVLSTQKHAEVEVYNQLGKLIVKANVSTPITLDTAGVYYVKTIVDDKIITQKLLVN